MFPGPDSTWHGCVQNAYRNSPGFLTNLHLTSPVVCDFIFNDEIRFGTVFSVFFFNVLQ